MPADEVFGLEHAQLVALVVELFARVEALAADNERLAAENARLRSGFGEELRQLLEAAVS